MNDDKVKLARLAAVLLFGCALQAHAQTFSSGSTGADGALTITNDTNTTVKIGGVYNYTTVTINAARTLRFFKNLDNAPVVILATGDVTINGNIVVSGFDSANNSSATGPQPGAGGGPGGFNGGNSGFNTPGLPVFQPTAGQGPAGGAPSTGGGGLGGQYGAPTAFVALTPLFGGSGGGGGQGSFNGSFGTTTIGGAGGGGAILIASSTRIIINGQIRANGGTATGNTFTCSGPGAGGAVRLVAPDISGTGNVQALHGNPATCGLVAGDGRIRVEAFTLGGFTGSMVPVASVATAPGAVSAAGNPQLANVPTLTIATIGNPPIAVPVNPTANYSTPDLTLPLGTTNPIPVVLNATNTPVGGSTVITVKVLPQGGVSSVPVAATDHSGTFASSQATVNVTLTAGQVTVLQASAAMTLTGQTASLFPLIDGEPVARVMVAATPGAASTLSLVTKSGREKRLDELSAEDRIKVALAWETMKGGN